MNTMVDSFHFLRPLWLLAVLPAGLLIVALWHHQKSSSHWNRAIDRSLLDCLLDNNQSPQQVLPISMLLVAWIIASLSLAGPVWDKIPQPVTKKDDALVIIQDLSLSMYATDLAPDRLTRSRRKLLDLINARTEGTTALIAYSGDAHIVAPLTSDTKTIAAMIPALSPAIMPSYGSNIEEAVVLALSLFKKTAITNGRILLITDEVDQDDGRRITDLLRAGNVTLSIIGAGSEDGSPIPTSEGFLKDSGGSIIVPRLNRSVLQGLAADNNGRYSDIQLTDNDIEYVLSGPAAMGNESYHAVERQFDQWLEQGPWLVLLLLPIALLAFRRGWVFGLLLFLVLSSSKAEAMTWQDLWLNKNQQAARALADNNPQQAAELFQSEPWKGTAAYRAGQFDEAAGFFSATADADSHYNQGNSLARAGKLKDALTAYEQALKLRPEMEDAAFNKQLVEKLLQQQQQQKDQSQQGQKQEKQQQDGQEQKDQEGQQSAADQKTPDGETKESAADQTSQPENNDRMQNSQNEKNSEQTEQAEQDKEQQVQKQDQADNSEKTAQQQNIESEKPDPEAKDESSTAAQQEAELTDEQLQSLQQWLRQIPDDPGGLLRRKFQYQYQTRKKQQTPENGKIW